MVRSGRNSNSSEILWMSSLPTYLKWILSIATEKKWQHRFFRRSRAANSQVSNGIWPKFELIQAFMHVLITCKYQKDRTLNSRDKVATPSFPMVVFFRRSKADNSVVSGPIWPKFELVRDIMHILVTYKFEMDLINSDREKVATSIF